LKLKRRIEKLENLAKTPQNKQLTLHDRSGKCLHGKIIKMPNNSESGIAVIDGKEYTIAVDISFSELLSLDLDFDQLQDSMGIKITPETLFLRKNNIKRGLELMASCIEQ
jgi:hypothetical protein